MFNIYDTLLLPVCHTWFHCRFILTWSS